MLQTLRKLHTFGSYYYSLDRQFTRPSVLKFRHIWPLKNNMSGKAELHAALSKPLDYTNHSDLPANEGHATIDSAPTADQTVEYLGQKYVTVKEGLAYILVPPNSERTLDTKAHQARLKSKSLTNANGTGEGNTQHDGANIPFGGEEQPPAGVSKPREDAAVERPQDVFYNEIMQYNRDLSVLAIKAFGEDFLARANLKKAGKRANKGGIRKSKTRSSKAQANIPTNEPSAEKADDNIPKSTFAPLKRPRDDTEDPTAPDHTAKRARVNHDVESDELEIPLEKTTSASEAKNDSESALIVENVSREEVTEPASLADGFKMPDSDMAGSEKSAFNHDDASKKNGESLKPNGEAPIPFRVLDALSATGLRALRYCHEIPFVTSVTANDLSPKAAQMIKNNVKHNSLGDKIEVTTGNAIAHMYSLIGSGNPGRGPSKYNVIDLDPYGSAAPFLDSAMQALQTRDSGLLCITCTDSGVFSSAGYPEKAFSTYGGTPLKNFACHEGGLRLLLNSIAMVAARYGLAIEPLLSLSIDYYARVFVRIHHSPSEVKMLSGKSMMVYNCSGCHALTPQWIGRNVEAQGKDGSKFFKHSFAQGPTVGEHCSHCGFKHHICGPLWGGPLHNPAFIQRILSYLPSLDISTYATTERLEGMLTTALEETTVFSDDELGMPKNNTSADLNGTNITDHKSELPSAIIPHIPAHARDQHPFYFSPSYVAKILHASAPSMFAIRGALRHAGYKATRTHAAREGIKTDASWEVIWHVMREWIRQKAPIKEGILKRGHAGWLIMQQAQPATASSNGDGFSSNGNSSKGDAASDLPLNNGEPGQQGFAEDVERENSQKLGWTANFDVKLGQDAGKKMRRYQINPRANWGPMAKAR